MRACRSMRTRRRGAPARRDAAAGHTGLVLHLELAGEVAAPHGLDEAAVFFLKLLRLVDGIGGVAMLVQILLRLGVEDRPARASSSSGMRAASSSRERDGDLLAVVAADGDADVVLNVARADLNAAARPSSPILRALPAEAVVADVDAGADAGGTKRLDRWPVAFPSRRAYAAPRGRR